MDSPTSERLTDLAPHSSQSVSLGHLCMTCTSSTRRWLRTTLFGLRMFSWHNALQEHSGALCGETPRDAESHVFFVRRFLASSVLEH